MPINLVKTFDYILCWIFIYFSVIQCVTWWSEYNRDAIDWLEIDQLARKQPTWFFLLIKTKNLPEKRVRLYLQLSFLSEKICLYVKSLDKSFIFKKIILSRRKRGGEGEKGRGERRGERRRRKEKKTMKKNKGVGKSLLHWRECRHCGKQFQFDISSTSHFLCGHV